MNNKKMIKEEIPTAVKVSNMHTYLHDLLDYEIKAYKDAGNIKTGFKNIDAITSIYPGIYVIGAISSLGKTTFVHQMVEQMAAAGENVIFFSFEQTILELTTKSLARNMAIIDLTTARSSLAIRTNDIDVAVKRAIERCDAFSNNITIVECSFRATIEDIENYVKEYIRTRKCRPIVVVDYLQVIQSNDRKKTSKDIVDNHVQKLKQLQSDNNLVMFVISSLNRTNYMTHVDYEAFKESGGIEYTADAVWGLQLQVLHEQIFNTQANINEKRKVIREAKLALPRRIELVCLKNRTGISSFSCFFEYYPQHDYFVPIMNEIDMVTHVTYCNSVDIYDCDEIFK